MTDVLLETGSKRVFASAVDWPGWSRGAREEQGALVALAAYGRRYGAVLKGTVAGFKPPKDPSALTVVERARGNASTDFGVPDLVAKADARALEPADVKRIKGVLRASWAAFDEIAAEAIGVELRKGPRGGGRELERIREHALEGEWSYLKRLGGAPPKIGKDVSAALATMHEAFIAALDGRLDGSIGTQGPRGRVFWPPRYAVRRAAWHVLDHAWEIEDRAIRRP